MTTHAALREHRSDGDREEPVRGYFGQAASRERDAYRMLSRLLGAARDAAENGDLATVGNLMDKAEQIRRVLTQLENEGNRLIETLGKVSQE